MNQMSLITQATDLLAVIFVNLSLHVPIYCAGLSCDALFYGQMTCKTTILEWNELSLHYVAQVSIPAWC